MDKRLDRIRWTPADMGIKPVQSGKVNLFELGDNVLKEFLRINSNELDLLLKQVTEADIALLSKANFSFNELRQVIALRNTYLAMRPIG
ncbi:hypothetical protein [Pontibacter anaerobius]|uniref:Uncharacterized protein n=1 Tax=Pontibacter anaerobius TaxID=2993940 RepID=A0ABT3RJB3_9BACT|nr:hypothetical protein [Pontibacter anaerobius]MCX2741463.1 hypothetical protein [Pontibacter anaerobius]